MLWALAASCALLSGCRQDMHDQPRYEPLQASTFFSDGQASRPLVEGTVARGQLHEDTYFYTGRGPTGPGDAFPFAIKREDLARGRERYNIYCAPCHARAGDGNGMVVQRGYRKPPSFHEDRLRYAPAGHYIEVMRLGWGVMPDYAQQIPARDRWLIVAYIRALQLSQNATVDDLPARERQRLTSPEAAKPAAPPAEGSTPR